MPRLVFWAVVALSVSAIVIILGANLAPTGSPVQEIFQAILDSVGAAWGNV